MNEITVDSFAGGGGASTGIEAALGRHIEIAINHNAAAIAMHQANHPRTKHYCESVYDVDPIEAAGGRPVGLLWASPDCFPAGTMVLTATGYRSIESVCVGDEVLTHKQRWRRVTETHSATRELVTLRGHGHHGLRVSPEHPFLIKRRRTRHVGHSFDEAAWTPARELEKGRYWATPTTIPALPVPAMRVATQGTSLPMDERLMWLAGRYLGDGWTRLTKTRAELVIICGASEREALSKRLDLWPRSGKRVLNGELAWQSRAVRTGAQFTANSRTLVSWLRDQFGHGASHKTVPGWVFGMPANLRSALLDGYLSADGWAGKDWKGKSLVEVVTVSRALAWGMRSLAATLGYAVAVYYDDSQPDVIEGRKVNVKPVIRLRWRKSIEPGHAQTFVDDGLRWSPIRERTAVEGKHRVYNFAVEEDESYVVEGVVVHNCTHHSRAKGTVPLSQGIRALAWVVIDWARAVRPRVIMLENVPEWEDWSPLDETTCRPIKERKGETFHEWLDALRALGYAVEWRSLVAADYGTPTTRKRLFLIARCDGQPITWPERTHGKNTMKPWRGAAEIIDWEIPCPSIFGRRRTLAEATLKRVARGLERYVFDAATPFVLPAYLTGANRGELAIVEPFIVRHGHYSNITGLGDTMRGQRLCKPLATVCGTNDKHIVAPIITKHFGGPNGHPTPGLSATFPLGAITARDHHALTIARLSADIEDRSEQVRAFITKWHGTSTGADLQMPLPTITVNGKGGGHLGLVIVRGEAYRVVDIGMRMLEPHELFAAQGFPSDYILSPELNGKALNKTQQIKLAGNSVCPQVAEALVAVNVAQARAA